ncbi:DUF4193 domain-containing protein [Streptomyces zaehneri]|uniref:DUF4193 domain-containing protein n=1 Tax=Streptomyces zaehneri TaxID=3051180 RepID=UPI0028D46F35|nr:DUF4193 domain-containing protein [Streptomyces sp. DSM 40713]
MAQDFDAPRNDGVIDNLEELKSRSTATSASTIDVDEFESAVGLELPGADLSDEQLVVQVLPQLDDEFVCATCFLVYHRSQLSDASGAPRTCLDCDRT